MQTVIQPPSEVSKWYSNQSIFVTGATGFMGKVLVEKLLRSCPKISTIYILIRNKKGRDALERLDDFLNCPLFDKIRDQPDGEFLFSKLQCINGDVTYPNCNLSDQNLMLLQENVTTMFHMAANVRFDQPLKSAVLLNVGGSLNILDMACTFKKLKAFVHVSTSYCHCNETELEERLYPAPHNPRHILEMAKWMDNELLKMLTRKLIRNSPNTYAYTKCLTEQLVSEYTSRLPIAIARPSIIIASWKDPFPGWVDNLNGPTGIMIAAGKGVLRTMHCNADYVADVVPVDMSVNCLLLIGWKTGTEPHKKSVEVYHVTANLDPPSNNDISSWVPCICFVYSTIFGGDELLVKIWPLKKALSWGEALDMGRKHFYHYPFSVCLWYPGGGIKSTYVAHYIAAFFLHVIPAYVVDFLMYLTNNKPFMVRTQKRIENGLSVLQYYTTRPWRFHNEKLTDIFDGLNKKDQEEFFIDRGQIEFDDYMKDYILGARKYCVHEEPETIPHARKVLKRLYYLDMLTTVLLCFLLVWILYLCFSNLLFSSDGYPVSFFNKSTKHVSLPSPAAPVKIHHHLHET